MKGYETIVTSGLTFNGNIGIGVEARFYAYAAKKVNLIIIARDRTKVFLMLFPPTGI